MKNRIDFKQITQKVIQSFKKGKAPLVIGIIGIVLIFLSTLIGNLSSSDAKKQQPATDPGYTAYSAGEYTDMLEKKLETTLGKVGGISDVHVMITLKNGTQNVYVKDSASSKNSTSESEGTSTRTENSSEEQNETVIVRSDGGESALLEKEIQPEIKGVAIVYQGGGSAHSRGQ